MGLEQLVRNWAVVLVNGKTDRVGDTPGTVLAEDISLRGTVTALQLPNIRRRTAQVISTDGSNIDVTLSGVEKMQATYSMNRIDFDVLTNAERDEITGEVGDETLVGFKGEVTLAKANGTPSNIRLGLFLAGPYSVNLGTLSFPDPRIAVVLSQRVEVFKGYAITTPENADSPTLFSVNGGDNHRELWDLDLEAGIGRIGGRDFVDEFSQLTGLGPYAPPITGARTGTTG